jgi:hypothetical protein
MKALCHVVRVAGKQFRYALIRRTGVRDTVVLDLGGPGTAALAAGYPRDLIARLRDVNVVVLDEPWTTARRSSACDHALTAWYRELRRWPARVSEAGRTSVRTSCELFGNNVRGGFTPASYRQLLAAVARRDRLVLKKFYGFSFGATRWSYASSFFDSAILVSPFPVGMKAHAYLEVRAAVKPPLFPQSAVGTRPASRSLRIAPLDLAAAQLEALYLDPAGRDALLALPDAPKVIGRLSDQLLGRYGEDSVSSAILAYWDETCPALSHWEGARPQDFGLTGELLQMCSTQPGRAHAPRTAVRTPRCVAVVRDDGIVPGAATTWLRSRWHWHRQAVVSGGHATRRGLLRCLGS